jgi:predicted ATPase
LGIADGHESRPIVRSQGRLGDARDQLASVYGRFTEGFETADLRTAKQLLDELAHGASRRD